MCMYCSGQEKDYTAAVSLVETSIKIGDNTVTGKAYINPFERSLAIELESSDGNKSYNEGEPAINVCPNCGRSRFAYKIVISDQNSENVIECVTPAQAASKLFKEYKKSEVKKASTFLKEVYISADAVTVGKVLSKFNDKVSNSTSINKK